MVSRRLEDKEAPSTKNLSGATTTRGTLRALLASGLLVDLLDANLEEGIDRDAFRRMIGLGPLNAFPVTVNYDLSVEEASSIGKYDWINADITSRNFSSTRKGQADLEIVLVHFDCLMDAEGVLSELDRQALRAAELPELLALGVRYPDVRRKFLVVALGSVWQHPAGHRGVPCLYGSPDTCSLSFSWLSNRWNSLYRFAAVRK